MWVALSRNFRENDSEAAEDRRLVPRNLVVLSMMAFGGSARADAGADIRALEERFVAAFKAKDLDAIMKAYAPGQTLVVFDVVPPRQYVGAAAYRKDWQTFFDSLEGPITVELTTSRSAPTAISPIATASSMSPAPTSRARSSISRCG